MNADCDHCHLHYEREPGYFLGSIYINYGLTALLVTLFYFALFFSGVVSPAGGAVDRDGLCAGVSDLVLSLRAQPVAGLRSLTGIRRTDGPEDEPSAIDAIRPRTTAGRAERRRATVATCGPLILLVDFGHAALLALDGAIGRSRRTCRRWQRASTS